MSEPINKYAADEEYELPEYKKISAEMLKIFKATTKADLTILEGNNHYADGLGFSRFWEYPWAIINSKVSKDMKVLDVGCGRAPFLPYLGKVIGCKAHGVDYDGSGCVEDGLWGCDEGFNAEYNFTVKKADAREHIPFSDNHFDRVFCINVVENMNNADEVRRAVKEMVRVLKPRGLLVITTVDGLYHREIEEAAGIPYLGECDFSKLKIKKPYSVLGMIFVKGAKKDKEIKEKKEEKEKPPSPPKEKEEGLADKLKKKSKKSLRERLVAINGLAEKIADEILEEYKSLDNIKKAIKNKSFKVGGVGPEKQKKIMRLRS